MKEISDKRDFAFDNIKAIMIILVVFGHMIEEFGYSGGSGLLFVLIYSFHMPLFAFISGYFSKNNDKCLSKAVSNLLIPYVIFDFAFVLFRYNFDLTKIDLFKPAYAYWYLAALFFWRISIKSLSKIKYLLFISIAVALICGAHKSINNYFTASRIICFFPFFILGYEMTGADVAKIRSKSKIIFGVLSLSAAIITVVLKCYDTIPARMYCLDNFYTHYGLDFTDGVIFRSTVLLIAFIFVFSFVNLVPDKKFFFTSLGSKTMTVYLFSGFLIKAFFRVYSHFFTVTENFALQLLICSVMTVVIVLITGNNSVSNIYNKVMCKISSFITVKEK